MDENNKVKENYWDYFLKREWSYTTGAVLLSVLAIALVEFSGRAWGVIGPFSNWGGYLLKLLGFDVDSWPVYIHHNTSQFQFWNDVPSMTNLGIVLGALLSVLLASSFKIKKIKTKKQVIAGILGGTLMGVGSGIAIGCNIGNLFSAIPAFSLHGWIFAAFMFLGAAVGSYCLKKWFI